MWGAGIEGNLRAVEKGADGRVCAASWASGEELRARPRGLAQSLRWSPARRGEKGGVRAGAPRSPTCSVSTGALGWEGCSRTCLVGGAPCCRSSSRGGTWALGAHGLSYCLSSRSLLSPLRKSTSFGTRIFIISVPSFCLFRPQFLLTLIFIFLLLLLLNCV